MSHTPRKIIIKESTGRQIIEQSRVRLLCAGLFFMLCFGSIGIRMVDIAIMRKPHAPTITVSDADAGDSEEVAISSTDPVLSRGDIVDRNGTLLATSLITASLYANPGEISNPAEAAARLAPVLGINAKTLENRLSGRKSFVWMKRNLTPKEQNLVNNLGIPGLYFSPEERRVYPYGNLLAHTVGYVGVDNHGLAGIEQKFDRRLNDASSNRDPIKLSIDVRMQAVMREEIAKAVSEFRAIGGAGVIMDMNSGELL